MENKKLTYSEFVKAAGVVVIAIAMVLQLFGVLQPDTGSQAAVSNAPSARGTTNFDELDIGDGTAADPAYGFTDDTDTGIYRVGANNIGMAVNGAAVLDVDSTGLDLQNNQLSNVGAAGTDFGSDGSLTTTGLTVNGNAVVTGTLDTQGNVSDSAGAYTIADNILVDGQVTSTVQLLVQGAASQSAATFTVEQSDGTDVATISNAGALDIASTFNYGANDLYPVGYASSGQQLVYGTATVTDTATVTTGLTTVTFALCSLGADPGTGAGDAAFCTVTVSGNAVTVKSWQDDYTAGVNSTTIQWLAVGAP